MCWPLFQNHAVETGINKTCDEEGLKKALKEKDSQLQDIQHKWNVWKEQTTKTLIKKCREEVNKEMERFVCQRISRVIHVVFIVLFIYYWYCGGISPKINNLKKHAYVH